MTIPNVNAFFAHLLLDRLVMEGAELCVISPGSRSAPLAAAAVSHPGISIKVIVDERAAAYYAVGYARSVGRAPILLCTSGTAAANYYPAVIEAYQSRLPLFVLTADRPEELQNRGANQTIDQESLYGKYAVSLTIPAPDKATDPAAILDLFEESLRCTWEEGGKMSCPLHINCRFREPLAPEPEPFDRDNLQAVADNWYRRNSVSGGEPMVELSEAQLEHMVRLAASSSAGLIVAGPEVSFRASRMIGRLSQAMEWPILADVLSQHRFTAQKNAGRLIGHYDLYLDAEEFASRHRPDLVLHLGGLPTSRRLQQFLALCRGIPYVRLQSHHRVIDPDRLQTDMIVTDVEKFLERLVENLTGTPNGKWVSEWLKADYGARKVVQAYVENGPVDEIAAVAVAGHDLPGGSALFLASSLAVREADALFPVSRKNILAGANRGVSGIDGIIASACGFAHGSNRSAVLIIGDLAFLHDLTSLRLAAESDQPIIIILLNNNGGGIFNFLPISRYPDIFETCFGTPHNMQMEPLVRHFGLEYHRPETIGDFSRLYNELGQRRARAVIEIDIDRAENVSASTKLRAGIREAVQTETRRGENKKPITWHWRKAGEDEKPTAVLLHGFMGDGGVWSSAMEELALDFHCLAPDLPGHGRTGADLEAVNFETLAREITDLGGETSLLIGYSMGGRIALYTALRYPDRVRGLVLESALAGIEDSGERAERLADDFRIAEKLAGSDMRSFLEEWYRQPVFAYLSDRPELVRRIIDKKSYQNPARLAQVLKRLSPGRQPSLWPRLAELKIPTLIVAGAKDEKYRLLGERMRRLIPGSELAVVPDAGHIVHLENYKGFMAALKSFLSSYIL